MSNRKPYWKNNKIWVCPEHLPSLYLPLNVSNCYFYGCSSVRPSKRELPKTIQKTKTITTTKKPVIQQKMHIICTLEDCDNPIENKSKRKKYCSDKCRKTYARRQYNIRLKNKKKV